MPTHTQIACPSCGARILAENMNLATMAAQCRACESSVDLRAITRPAHRPAASDVGQGSPRPGPRPVPRPPRFFIERRGADLVISLRWFMSAHVGMGIVAVLWLYPLVPTYSQGLASGNVLDLLFSAPHLIAGIALLYVAVAGFVNTTVITVQRGHLTVRHGPVPWPGNRDLPTSLVKQLFCQRKVWRARNGGLTSYSVMVMTKSHMAVKLVSELLERESALYIEQEIEKHLGIADQRVASEMRR